MPPARKVPASPDAPLVEALPWDTEHFGFPIGRYTAEHMDETAATAAEQQARALGLRCVYFLAAADETASIAAAQRHGFRLVDVRLTLEHSTSLPAPPAAVAWGAAEGWREGRPAPPASVMNKLALRPAESRDRAELDALARLSFTGTRFHADPGFPRAKAEALYGRWLQRDLELEPDGVIVAELGHEVAGFISTRSGPSRGQISLIAVAERFRAAGVGGVLVAAALERLCSQGAPTVTVVTQGQNVGAMRMYERAGFRAQRVDLWFHCWPGADQ